MDKIRVAVLYGGRSAEHEVSLLSATNVIQNLDRTRFEVIPIGIDKQGGWFLGDDILKKEITSPALLRLQRDADRMLFSPDLIGTLPQQLPIQQLLAEQSSSGRIFDVIFPAIHGLLCEDGTVQGLLELADIAYVGCGVLSSAIGMDKDISKRLIQHAGIKVPTFLTIKRGQWDKNPTSFCEKIAKELSYPVFVKPANTGSSVGVHKVKNVKDLITAIHDAFQYDTKIIVEQGIVGREIEVAVLESLEPGADPIVSIPGEIKPAASHEFYSYSSKYLDENGAQLLIPASLTKEQQANLQQTAKDIFIQLECEGMARVDLFLEQDTDHIYFNEVNSLPGFTKISMYPKLMEASGVAYSQLLTHLISLAIDRHAKRAKLSHDYISSVA